MSDRSIRLAAICLSVAAAAVAADSGPPGEGVPKAVSVLLLGDTGYDYGWLEAEDLDSPLDVRAFAVAELDDWLEDGRPIDEFRLPPMHRLEATGGYVMASGMWPVSKAARRWCDDAQRCDFGVMLGDNIYPAGATLGADGRDDAARFRELLWAPYEKLRDQNPGFRVYPVLGNHDWETSREGALAQVAYLQGSPLFHMPALFYRQEAAPGVEVFAIDTTVMLAGEKVYEDSIGADGQPRQTGEIDAEVPWATPRGDEARMLAWLETALAQSQARWKLVIGHHPLWASSGSKHEESKVLRRLLMPVLCRYADAYLAGHDHTLEVHTDDCRTAAPAYRKVPPLLQVVSGAAGKQRPLHTPFMAWQDGAHPQKTTHFARGLIWGFAELELAGDSATVHVVSTPDSGTGEPQLQFTRSFARRSAASREVAP